MDEFTHECRGCFGCFPYNKLNAQGYCETCEIKRQNPVERPPLSVIGAIVSRRTNKVNQKWGKE